MKHFLILLSSFLLSLNANEQTLLLGNNGSVRYLLNDEDYITQIERLSPLEEVLYTHSYFYDENGKLVSEYLTNRLDEVVYSNDLSIIETSKIHSGDFVRPFTEYNDSGCLTKLADKEYTYDNQNRLIQVVTPDYLISYTYDTEGNRVSRTVNGKTEHFVFSGINEIAILDEEGNILELRIPGMTTHKEILRPIAIEKDGTAYVPILNKQGTIIKLVDIDTKEESVLNKADLFGEGLYSNAPTSWIYCGKYFDKEANLVNFGARFYSPELREWITPDPLKQSSDPYLFCLGDPANYIDPNGKWAVAVVSLAWGAGAAVTFPAWGSAAIGAAAGATIGYVSYKCFEKWWGYSDDQIQSTKTKDKKQKEMGEPPFTWDDLGDDPAICPEEGFEWRGRGTPESGKGNWVRGKRSDLEKLNPDLDHQDPVGPHWDYQSPDYPKGIRIKPDGSWEHKIK